MRSELWKHMHEEHGLSLLESELNDIETIVYADLRKLRDNWRDRQRHWSRLNVDRASSYGTRANEIDKLLNREKGVMEKIPVPKEQLAVYYKKVEELEQLQADLRKLAEQWEHNAEKHEQAGEHGQASACRAHVVSIKRLLREG